MCTLTKNHSDYYHGNDVSVGYENMSLVKAVGRESYIFIYLVPKSRTYESLLLCLGNIHVAVHVFKTEIGYVRF